MRATSASAAGLAFVLLALSGATAATPASSPVALRPLTAWIREACGGLPRSIRDYCPTVVPAGPRGLTLSLLRATRRYPVNLLQLEAGGEYFGNQRRNRPPRYVALFLASGNLGRALPELFPPPGVRPAPVRDGLANVARTTGLAFGRRRWGGIEGQLSLAPSHGRIPLVYFNYLLFRWRDRTGDHVLGLHKWEPFHETVRTLHALVDRLGPAAAVALVSPAAPTIRGGVATAPSPRWLLTACRSLRTRRICPSRIPAANPRFIDLYYEPQWGSRKGSAGANLIGVSWGAPHDNQPTRDRPPRFLHLDLTAGAVRVRWHFDQPVARVRNGLMRGRGGEATPGPLPLGRRQWNGRRGVLVLGDCFGNHLCFRWRERGVAYQIDLHGWEPFTQTVAALRGIVFSLPPRAR
jgi:hypothetical protein